MTTQEEKRRKETRIKTTIQKAIEILERWQNGDDITSFDDVNISVALGIEALKLIKKGRTKPGGMFFHDLPGETED